MVVGRGSKLHSANEPLTLHAASKCYGWPLATSVIWPKHSTTAATSWGAPTEALVQRMSPRQWESPD
jgi:hypothetical protein